MIRSILGHLSGEFALAVVSFRKVLLVLVNHLTVQRFFLAARLASGRDLNAKLADKESLLR